MSLDKVNWQPVCCAECDEYAEHPMVGGGVVRLMRGRLLPGVRVCRFGPDNLPIDKDDDGVPASVTMTEAEALALLA